MPHAALQQGSVASVSFLTKKCTLQRVLCGVGFIPDEEMQCHSAEGLCGLGFISDKEMQRDSAKRFCGLGVIPDKRNDV